MSGQFAGKHCKLASVIVSGIQRGQTGLKGSKSRLLEPLFTSGHKPPKENGGIVPVAAATVAIGLARTTSRVVVAPK
jgi:hypothetical protein